jgi:hypothetical protein
VDDFYEGLYIRRYAVHRVFGGCGMLADYATAAKPLPAASMAAFKARVLIASVPLLMGERSRCAFLDSPWRVSVV